MYNYNYNNIIMNELCLKLNKKEIPKTSNGVFLHYIIVISVL